MQAALPGLEADVLVTVTPALLSLAARLRPAGTALVHQEHRSSSQRTSGLEPLLTYAPAADTVALLTEPMAHWLRERLGGDCPPLAVVPNALPPGFRPRSLLDEPLVVAAGRLAGEKQYPQLVEAFALVADRLPGWRLRIYGEGPGRFEIMQAVRRLGLWDRVEVPGSTTDLAAEWARASISALTSRSEGFPLVLQEAMAAGVPVVSYDCPSGPRAIIDDEVDGLLVAQDSPADLAAALLRLAEDPALRATLGAAALRKAAEFDSATITDRWLEVYAAAVAGRHQEAPCGPEPRPSHRSQDEAPLGAEGLAVTPDQAAPPRPRPCARRPPGSGSSRPSPSPAPSSCRWRAAATLLDALAEVASQRRGAGVPLPARPGAGRLAQPSREHRRAGAAAAARAHPPGPGRALATAGWGRSPLQGAGVTRLFVGVVATFRVGSALRKGVHSRRYQSTTEVWM